MKEYLVYLQNTASEKEHNYPKVSGISSDAKIIYVEAEPGTDPENLAYLHFGDEHQDWHVIKVEPLNN